MPAPLLSDEATLVRWHTADHPPCPALYAIPCFHLTGITDRWERSVSISWGTNGVSSVADGSGHSLAFSYANGLISSISDTLGRTHTLSYSNLTRVGQAYGTTSQTKRTWSTAAPPPRTCPRRWWTA